MAVSNWKKGRLSESEAQRTGKIRNLELRKIAQRQLNHGKAEQPHRRANAQLNTAHWDHGIRGAIASLEPLHSLVDAIALCLSAYRASQL
jgi:hypothetical protein